MSKRCAWAAINENGQATGGNPGDQTGNEVKIGGWYQFGQTAVYRFKNRQAAESYAAIIGGAANNANVGYDQYRRLSFYKRFKAAGWDITKVNSPCACDCSSLTAACLNAIGYTVDPNLTTYTIPQALEASGRFEKLTGSAYTGTDENLIAGDIINNPAHHVISCIEGVQPAMGPMPPADDWDGGSGGSTGAMGLPFWTMKRILYLKMKRFT